jgi:hypothetical protein
MGLVITEFPQPRSLKFSTSEPLWRGTPKEAANRAVDRLATASAPGMAHVQGSLAQCGQVQCDHRGPCPSPGKATGPACFRFRARTHPLRAAPVAGPLVLAVAPVTNKGDLRQTAVSLWLAAGASEGPRTRWDIHLRQ